MFTKKAPSETGLDKAIDEVLREMQGFTSDTEEYATMVTHLSTLYKLKETSSPKGVSADTMAIIAGNLVGIMVIVGYERANIIGSKALSFVMKLR